MKVLEVNVDDLHSGGVYSLVKNVIVNKKAEIKIDIAAIERFVNTGNIDMLKQHNCDVRYVGYEGNKWKKQLVCYFNLKKLLKEQSYDCVHIHADTANKLMVSGLAAKHAGINKIILHSHAAGTDGNHRFAKRIIHKICNRFLKRIGTDFVACSNLAAQWMFPNIKNEKIKIINNGVDLDKFRYNSEIRKEVRDKLNLKNNKVIGHVGRFAYQKNHEFLIRIMKQIKKNEPSMRLILVGEGPEEERIQSLVKKNHLEDVVIFYGTSNSVCDLFQAMDIFVLPSHFEGLPIVGVEAQAAGLPVLFSDQITREAKIISPVEFLSISDGNIKTWVNKINEYSSIEKNDTYEELKKQKFSIQDTIDSFLDLYK